MTAQQHADVLAEEAKARLNNIFHASNLEYSFEDVSRIVDCIISASILTIAALQQEALRENPITETGTLK